MVAIATKSGVLSNIECPSILDARQRKLHAS